MSNLDDMSPEERWAWAERQKEESRRRFAGQPVPRISRAKREDYPHLEFKGWAFRLYDGAPARVRQGRTDERCLDGVVRGLREVSDGGPLALLVDLGADGLWALRRDDDEVWADHVGARDGTAWELEVPVVAWALGPASAAQAESVSAPRSVEPWTVRTNKLEETRMTPSGADGDRFEEFLATLEKLPRFRGVTFRGCSGEAQFVRDGQSVVTRGLVSTSRNLDVATGRRTTPALYAVMSRSGRDISPFSAKREEHEIVFLPGTLFFLAESRRLAGLDVRLVFELEPGAGPQQLPDDLVSRFAEEMERFLSSRLAEPVAQVEPVPGKFSGDVD